VWVGEQGIASVRLCSSAKRFLQAATEAVIHTVLVQESTTFRNWETGIA
jgi:hypothetical protein